MTEADFLFRMTARYGDKHTLRSLYGACAVMYCNVHNKIFRVMTGQYLTGTDYCPQCMQEHKKERELIVQAFQKQTRKMQKVEAELRAKEEHQRMIDKRKADYPFPPKIEGETYLRTFYIERMQALHGDKYKIVGEEIPDDTITRRIFHVECSECGNVFDMRTDAILRGRGCPHCAHNQHKTTESFIKELQVLYRDDYDYSQTEYVNSRTSVAVRCKKHDKTFKRSTQNILLGYGCPDCMKEQGKTFADMVENNYDKSKGKPMTNEVFCQRVRKIYGNRYTFEPTQYVNKRTPVLLHCAYCGEDVSVHPDSILRGTGHICVGASKHTDNEIRWRRFIDKAVEVHGMKYLYPWRETSFDNTRVPFVCLEHGLMYHTSGTFLRGSGCPICEHSAMTKGEQLIDEALKKMNVEHIYQYRLPVSDLFTQSVRSYMYADFYLPDHNMIIEFNGKQHYEYVAHFHRHKENSFEEQQIRDDGLRLFCREHNLRLLEISYKDEKNITSILSKNL